MSTHIIFCFYEKSHLPIRDNYATTHQLGAVLFSENERYTKRFSCHGFHLIQQLNSPPNNLF